MLIHCSSILYSVEARKMSCANTNADAIHYFVDGSCIGNGAGDPAERSAAYAVVKAFAQQFVEQHAEAIDRSLPQTNQYAELVAFQYAFTDIETKHVDNKADQQAGNPITIYSDSMYAINCITTWGPLCRTKALTTAYAALRSTGSPAPFPIHDPSTK